jgi:DNA polymerase (family 10)
MLLEKNQKIASIFKEMAAIYKYMGAEERFRSISYNKASRVIESLKEDISEYIKSKTLDDIPGIGKSISEKIIEFVKTGSIKKYEILKKNTPHELIEMMEIRGFGPQSLKKINNELNINTKEQLINALNEGKINKLKGFGKKKTEGMLRGLKIHKTIEKRLLLWNALKIGNQIIDELKQIPEVIQIELAGSLRRKKETIGDIDILISSIEKNRNKIINNFTRLKSVKQILVKGVTKASVILKKTEIQVDLRILKDEEWGSALQYFTGSKEHNIHLRSIAKEKGYKISEYDILDINTQKKTSCKTEEDVYKTISYNIMPPEIREDKGELEQNINKNIPKLISEKDIKGDFHIHSKWSDGLFSIEEIAKYIKKEYQYKYIVITDHSKSSRIANGMDEKKIMKQLKEIETINKNLGENFIKSGIEVDILTNGDLDISDEVLEQLDWVTASIHSRFNEDNTERLIKACENKSVNCIGHPTGRLIGQREPYQLDIIKLIDIAKKTNTALEINAQPQRMDLKDDLAMYACEQGVKLVIGSDTHSLQDFEYINLGVYIARRAWCKSSDIINTMLWLEIENWKKINQKNTTKKILSY